MTATSGHYSTEMPDTPFASHSLPVSTSREVPPKLSIVALRERKKDQTRDALARASFALFADKGYEATTVAEIARAANVSRRTFFRYYATKDALLFVDNSDYLARFSEFLTDARKQSDGLDHIRIACMNLAGAYMENRDRVLARARIIDSSAVLAKQERQQDVQWEDAIAQSLVADNSAMSTRRARTLAAATFGAIRATLAEWREAEGQVELTKMLSEALDLFVQ